MTVVAGASLSLRCDRVTSPACRQIALYAAATMPECRAKASAADWLINGRICVCGPCQGPAVQPAIAPRPSRPRGPLETTKRVLAERREVREIERARARERAKRNPTPAGAYGTKSPEQRAQEREPELVGTAGVLPIPSSTYEF